MTIEELEEIFREWFPVELEGKTAFQYFRKFSAVQNRNLINYKPIKEKINKLILSSDVPETAEKISISTTP